MDMGLAQIAMVLGKSSSCHTVVLESTRTSFVPECLGLGWPTVAGPASLKTGHVKVGMTAVVSKKGLPSGVVGLRFPNAIRGT